MRVEGSRRDDVIAMVARVSPQARLTLKGGGHVSFALPSADLDLPTLFDQVQRTAFAENPSLGGFLAA